MGSSLITPDPGTIVWTVVTFVILAFLLGRFAWKPLLLLLEEREPTIRDSLEESRKARAEAEEVLRRNQELVEQGKRQVQYEQKQAMEQLRSQVADLAIRAAERLIVRSLDDTKHRE